METITIAIKKSIGYSGKHSGKSYIAKIRGTDDHYIFSREFLATSATDRAEMFAARRKRKGTWTEAAALDAGLYEISEYGERSYRIVYWHAKKATTMWTDIDVDRATHIALLMDDGQEFDSARRQTKPPEQHASVNT